MVSTAAPARSRAGLRAAGRALRERSPRRTQGQWHAPDGRRDPIELLERSNATRLPELVAVRHGRMLQSPFAFYRGMPLVMASDLSRTPTTGVNVQLCGDAHLMNFGMFATPERNLIFDLNDFDETHQGPWEWDVKRLAASLVVATRDAGLTDTAGVDAVHRCAAEYRTRMAALAELTAFEIWHTHIDAEALVAAAPNKQARSVVARTVTKARKRTSLKALPKLTALRDGSRVIVEDPPLVARAGAEQFEQAWEFAKAYSATLEPDVRLLFDRYELVDVALKVVGVGSVGTRCYIALLAGRADLDPLFLQIKEAQPSVLTDYTSPSRFRNQGKRVVVGQRIIQASSDAFLGWSHADGFDFYVRQLRDMKGGAEIESATSEYIADYGRLCGATLAAAHARSGEPALLAGYMGSSTAFEEALGAFALAYADQTQRDYETFVGAVRSGRLQGTEGR